MLDFTDTINLLDKATRTELLRIYDEASKFQTAEEAFRAGQATHVEYGLASLQQLVTDFRSLTYTLVMLDLDTMLELIMEMRQITRSLTGFAGMPEIFGKSLEARMNALNGVTAV